MLWLLVAGCAGTSTWTLTLTNTSSPGALATSAGAADIALAPGVVIVHEAGWELLPEGGDAHNTPLEPLAEDGDPHPLLDALADDPAVLWAEVMSALSEVDYEEAALGPGGVISAQVTLGRGERLSFAAMFGQSNDALIAAADQPARAGPVALRLVDVGTEVDQEPGAGDTQAPRQAAPDTGPDEGERITTFEQRDGEWVWPNVADFAALELVPDDAKGGQVR